MTTKAFFNRFAWGTFFPAILFGVVGVLTASMYPASMSASAGYAYEFLTAALLLLSAGLALPYFILRGSTNIGQLLFGVGCVSVSVYLFVPTLVRWKVIPIAMGLLMLLFALSEGFAAFDGRKEAKARSIVRFVFAAAFGAAGVVSCVRPFAAMSANWTFSGVLIAVQAVCGIVFLALGGLFREEEQLKFRPVKKQSAAGEPPSSAAQSEPPQGEPPQGEISQSDPPQGEKSQPAQAKPAERGGRRSKPSRRR